MTQVYNEKQRSEAIYHHVVNNSTAQHRFSWGSQTRLPNTELGKTATDFKYDVANRTFGPRAAGFGYGARLPLPKTNSPPPGAYKIKTTFDGFNPTICGNELSTKFKNQASRQAFGKVYVPGKRSESGYEKDPGPDHYHVSSKSVQYRHPGWSLVGRTPNVHDPVQKAIRKMSPGPGAYKHQELTKTGKYNNSTIP